MIVCHTNADSPNLPPAISPPITQIVSETVKSGYVYTLNVDLGARNDMPFGSAAGLLIGGTLYSATGTVPTPGNWSTFTATFIGTNATAGDSIEIELLNTGYQGDFDAIYFTDGIQITPEPSSISLLALGLAALSALPGGAH